MEKKYLIPQLNYTPHSGGIVEPIFTRLKGYLSFFFISPAYYSQEDSIISPSSFPDGIHQQALFIEDGLLFIGSMSLEDVLRLEGLK